MTEVDPELQRDELYAAIKSRLSGAAGTYRHGYRHEIGSGRSLSNYLVSMSLSGPALDQLGAAPTFEEVLRTAADQTRRWNTDLWDTLVPRENSTIEAGYFCSFSGVDFPGETSAQPRGMPKINTVMIVPDSVRAAFEAWISERFPAHGNDSSEVGFRITHFRKLGSSKKAVDRGLDHVLAFVRRWPFIVQHRNDLKRHFVTMFSEMHRLGIFDEPATSSQSATIVK